MGVVGKKKETAVAVADELQGDWGKFDGDVTDILIPKLLCAQFTSKAVQEDGVKPGSLHKSGSLKVAEALELIPLVHSKTWVMSEKVGGKYEFRGVKPYKAEDANLPWYFTCDKAGAETAATSETATWKREKALNFYGLIPSDIAADIAAREEFEKTGELPDTDDSLLPVVLQFKSTSYNAGKKLITHFAKAADFGAPPFSVVFTVGTEKKSNDRGTFFSFTTERAGKPDPAHLKACRKWYDIIKSQGVKVDNSDLEAETVATDVAGEEF